MATQPIGGESAPVITPPQFPPAAAGRIAASLLNRHSAHEIAEAVTVLIDVLDLLGGDADEEDDDPDLEPTGDEEDGAWVEWQTMRGSQKRGPNILPTYNEDDEDDDPAEEDDPSGQCTEDEISCGAGHWAGSTSLSWNGPGCPIADTGEEEPDAEGEQMGGDVPVLPVYSLEHNIFNDERQFLGYSNLQSSFVGQDIRSADTGALHTGRPPRLTSRPGEPV
jgi:hypothetical protein